MDRISHALRLDSTAELSVVVDFEKPPSLTTTTMARTMSPTEIQ
jgi:hypothetical protein